MIPCSHRRTGCFGKTYCHKNVRPCNNLETLWCKGIIIGVFTAFAFAAFAYGAVYGWQGSEDREEANRFKAVVLYTKMERLQRDIQAETRLREQVLAVIACESSGRHDGVWGDSGKSYGLTQLQKPTWEYLSAKAGIQGHWQDKNDQVRLLGWAIQNGFGNHWTCWRKLNKEGI